MSDFRNHTCGDCAWWYVNSMTGNGAPIAGACRNRTVYHHKREDVKVDHAACPAFVPTAPEAETPHPYTVECKCCGSVFRTFQKGCTKCGVCKGDPIT